MQISKTERFWTIRVRPADGLHSVGFPDWAQTVARRVSPAARVRLARPATDGWLVECIRLHRCNVESRQDAREAAVKIVEGIER